MLRCRGASGVANLVSYFLFEFEVPSRGESSWFTLVPGLLQPLHAPAFMTHGVQHGEPENGGYSIGSGGSQRSSCGSHLVEPWAPKSVLSLREFTRRNGKGRNRLTSCSAGLQRGAHRNTTMRSCFSYEVWPPAGTSYPRHQEWLLTQLGSWGQCFF